MPKVSRVERIQRNISRGYDPILARVPPPDYVSILMRHGVEKEFKLYECTRELWETFDNNCPVWFDDTTSCCEHPRGVIVAGSSIEQYSKNVSCMRLSQGRTTRLTNLDHALRHVGMIYDVDTGKLTIAGGETRGKEDSKAVFQLSPRSSGAKWMKLSNELPYNVNNPMLVTDDKYLYVLGGDNCRTCIRTDKKDPSGWQNICTLPTDDNLSEQLMSEQYSGRFYSGALVSGKRVTVITRTCLLSYDSTKDSWDITPYINEEKIDQITPIIHDCGIVASIKRGQTVTVESWSSLGWTNYAKNAELGIVGAGRIVSHRLR